MKRLTLMSLALMVVGCTAVVKDPDDTVATFNLYQDHLEALLIQECVDANGVAGCTPQPNLLECTQMTVKIRADGRTWIDCRKSGEVVKTGFARIDEGSPFRCITSDDMGCQKCVDAFENVVLDNCSRNTQLFRRSAVGQAGKGGFLVEPGDDADGKPSDSTPPNTSPGGDNSDTPDDAPLTPNGGAGGICDPKNAANSYAHQLNRILKHEGMNFSWSPDLSQILDPKKKGLFYGSSGLSGANNNCQQFAKNVKSHIHTCAVQKNGQCYYCWDSSGGKKTCRCYRVNLAALKAACGQIPAGCDRSAWSQVMIQAHGLSNKWLFSSSYSGNFYGKVNPPDGQKPNFPKCKGSPLVLDLAGDGIKPSAPADGVQFDLMGTGQLKTAWIAGDDALLALDRDGNGRIDSGAELFGEVTAGVPQEGGFEALAQLDKNSDGKIDRKDPGYKQLVVWQDRNHDGISQGDELRSLAGVGVTSLGTGMSLTGSIDEHGNDMRMQGDFTRADGSAGLMVDVFFVVK